MNLCTPFDDNLTCGLCEGILDDPLQCPDGHVFCGQCFANWINHNQSCPCSRCSFNVKIDIQQLRPAPKPLIATIANLDNQCKNIGEGCREVLKLSKLAAHEKNCVKALGVGHDSKRSKFSTNTDDKFFREVATKLLEKSRELSSLLDQVQILKNQIKSAERTSLETNAELNKTRQDLQNKVKVNANAISKFNNERDLLIANNKFLNVELARVRGHRDLIRDKLVAIKNAKPKVQMTEFMTAMAC